MDMDMDVDVDAGACTPPTDRCDGRADALFGGEMEAMLEVMIVTNVLPCALGEQKDFEVYSCHVSSDGKRLATAGGGMFLC